MNRIASLTRTCGAWLQRHPGLHWPFILLDLTLLLSIPAWLPPIAATLPFGVPAAYFIPLAFIAPFLMFFHSCIHPQSSAPASTMLHEARGFCLKYRKIREELQHVIPIALEHANQKQTQRVHNITKETNELHQKWQKSDKHLRIQNAYTSKSITRTCRMNMLLHRDEAKALLTEITDFLDKRNIPHNR